MQMRNGPQKAQKHIMNSFGASNGVEGSRHPLLCAFCAFCGYSYLNATSGSTRVARRAGIEQAKNAAQSATSNTIMYVAGSDAETPNNSDDIQRVSANAPAKPIAAPINVSTRPFRNTIIKIAGR